MPADVDAAQLVGHPPAPDVPVGKLAAQVARRIEAEVLRQGWPVGRSLGAEPQLRERFGVSRAILREAVRLVEHHQVARMRRGPGGGLFVTAPDAGPATEAMVIYLEYVGTTVADLLHARSLLEPLAVALAADRVTEDGIERLRHRLGREAGDPAAEVTTAWAGNPLHVLLAGLSGNPVLELFVDVLTRLTDGYLRAARRPGAAARAAAIANAQRMRGAVVEAVVAGDGPRAAARMTEYLDAEARWLDEHRPPGPGPAIVRPEQAAGARLKLAEVIAARIRADIRARDWPVDAVLGSEADLLVRYGISRAVLREAVRLLEYHAVARMRRGPGGGLIVTRPDPQASIDTMALHLEYRGVSRDDLSVVRDTIELGALDRLLAGHPGEGDLGRLREAVEHVVDGPPGDPEKPDLFHFELAELAGNPVLVVFLRILIELFRRHTAVQDQPPPVDEAADEVHHAHQRILEAVRVGDAGLARHRMRRHLDAVSPFWH